MQKTVIGARCKQSGMFWSGIGRREHPGLPLLHSSRRPERILEAPPIRHRGPRRLPPPGELEEFCLTPSEMPRNSGLHRRIAAEYDPCHDAENADYLKPDCMNQRHVATSSTA